MIGRQIAHYEIREKLGQGGMGEVYRAHDSKLGREVAIKVLPEEPASDPERRARFLREARSIAALKHPNIVTVHSVEEVDGIPFITMELVEGRSLSEMIGSDGLRLDRFFEYAIPLADAVGWAHDRGITHRDLKPANIMIDSDGRLKILDFGLAKVFAPDVSVDTAETVVRTHDTAAGRILGTPSYMSPEQAEGKPVDSRSDIFSLGIVLYEMATGKRPFEGDTPISTISSILKDHPKSVSDLRPANPRELGRIISHCLEKDPERRFQTAKDVRNELEGLRREVDSGEVVTTGQIRHESRPGLRLSRPMAIVGVVLGVAIAAGYLFMRNRAASEMAGLSAPPKPGAPGAMETKRQMAVVFPFQNLGPAEDAYFASGITEEINSRLASVSGLGIISRTTAENYDRSGKTTKQIGADLGVDYVLDGSVRWAKSAHGTGRVRITPQLVRVSDDTPVWTENYDRELSDIFDVQTDIATHVVDALGVTLQGNERESLEERPTQNLEAYEAYLRAKDNTCNIMAGCDAEKTANLERAVKLDPAFLAAWSELARHHAFMYHTGIDRTEARLARARDALEHAEAIDASHPLTRLGRGFYYYYGFRDYDRALTEFSAVAEARPNDAEAIFSIALINRRQGDFQAAVDHFVKAIELDPKNQQYLENLGGTYQGMRLPAKAHDTLERAFAVSHDESVLGDMGSADLHATGDLAAARRTLARAKDPRSPLIVFLKAEIELWAQDYAGAYAALKSIDVGVPALQAMVHAMTAMMATGVKGPAGARPELESSTKELEAVLATAPSESNVRGVLALVYAYLGQSDDAIREGRLAADLIAKDAFEGPSALENLAAVYANTGHPDEALDLIERLLGMNYGDPLTIPKLRYQPYWEPLRENPRFKALLNRSS